MEHLQKSISMTEGAIKQTFSCELAWVHGHNVT